MHLQMKTGCYGRLDVDKTSLSFTGFFFHVIFFKKHVYKKPGTRQGKS